MPEQKKSGTAKSGNRSQPAKFNPLALNTLAETMVAELLKQSPVRLDALAPFEGPGVYAIYYTGSFEPYRSIAAANRNKEWKQPIYVGKALFERLRNHADSIKEVSNLDIEDFWCRHLVTEEVFIPLCEKLLITRYKPIWNVAITGFGPKVVGKERTNQQASAWDILHPGRHGRGAAPNRRFKSASDVKKRLEEFFQEISSSGESPPDKP